MFTNSHHFIVNAHQFINNSSSKSSIGIDILLKASSPEAAYDSSARDPPPSCHPGTREQYIEDIVDWALPGLHSDTSLPLLWVKGPAGVGKSALAQSCVVKIKGLHRPCAGFFFSMKRWDKPQRLFPSIAYQLSTIFPAYRELLGQKICHDKTLVDKAMDSQFRSLLVEPIQELETSRMGIGSRVPIFIDGLDECEGASAQCDIIEIISASVCNNTTPFCWAFFSRPEPQLENTFRRPNITSLCNTTFLPISRDIDGEIELYLKANLQNVQRRRTVSRELSWPSDDQMKILIQGAGGLFIYAATVLRIVSQPGSVSPEDRLSEIVTAIHNSDLDLMRRSAPPSLAGLDAFYMLIMEGIPADMLPVVRLFCAVLCLHTNHNPGLGMSAMVLSNVLRVSGPVFESICSQLSAIIHFRGQSQLPIELADRIGTTRSSSDHIGPELLRSSHNFIDQELGGSISFYHKSFYDFLNDPARSGAFCVVSSTMSNIIFNHCIDLGLDYEKSYCIRDSELVLAPDVPDSAFSLSNPSNSEPVNSAIKLCVYVRAGGVGGAIVGKPVFDPKLRKRLRDLDYTKDLLIVSSYCKQSLRRSWMGRCLGWRKDFKTTSIFWICGDAFDQFDATAFKQGIKAQREAGNLKPYFSNFTSRFEHLVRRKSDRSRIESGLYAIKKDREAGILKPYFSNLTSRFEHLFRRKSDRSRIELGLYLRGRGSKSIFWYWEINYELQSYRYFETASLAEGQKIFQAIPWDELLADNMEADWEEVECKTGLKS